MYYTYVIIYLSSVGSQTISKLDKIKSINYFKCMSILPRFLLKVVHDNINTLLYSFGN